MTKKIVTIIFLIISILALVYMFLAHYGIIRNYRLKNSPLESFTHKYGRLPKADKNRVVIVFTIGTDNLEKSLDKLNPFLNSILDQTVRVDDIAIVLPSSHSLTRLPKKYSFLSPYYHEVDYGESACLVTTVLREPESDTKIILVSPDKMYGKEFIQAMIESSNESPEKVIEGGEKEILVKPKFFNEEISSDGKRSVKQIIEGLEKDHCDYNDNKNF